MGEDIDINVGLNQLFSNFRASQAEFENTADSDKAKKFDLLLEKYSEAIRTIEQLKAKINEQSKNKLPTKDEIESISSMLDVLNKLDIKTLDKLNQLGGKGRIGEDS